MSSPPREKAVSKLDPDPIAMTAAKFSPPSS
jgi:hypothetical protein